MIKHGFGGDREDLTAVSPALAAFLVETDPRLASNGVEVLGVSLGIGAFFASLGLFLAVLAFVMLGPLLALVRVDSKEHSQPWIMVLKRHGAGGPARAPGGWFC